MNNKKLLILLLICVLSVFVVVNLVEGATKTATTSFTYDISLNSSGDARAVIHYKFSPETQQPVRGSLRLKMPSNYKLVSFFDSAETDVDRDDYIVGYVTGYTANSSNPYEIILVFDVPKAAVKTDGNWRYALDIPLSSFTFPDKPDTYTITLNLPQSSVADPGAFFYNYGSLQIITNYGPSQRKTTYNSYSLTWSSYTPVDISGTITYKESYHPVSLLLVFALILLLVRWHRKW